jgi:DNA-binding MarR family transcriptional regulator
MTRIVQALQARGFVRLEGSSKDGRVTICEASSSGISVVNKARQARLDRIEKLLSRSELHDITLLGKALEAIVSG